MLHSPDQASMMSLTRQGYTVGLVYKQENKYRASGECRWLCKT